MALGPGMSRDKRPASRPLAETLVRRLRAGEPTAYEEAVRAFAPKVRALAWRMLGNAEDAEDAIQEVFLRLYRYRRRLDPRRDPLPWLYRVAVNVCRTMLKRRRPAPVDIDDAAEDVAVRAGHNGDQERRLAATDARRTLLIALQGLSPDERATVILRDLMGLSTAEVARALRCRPGTTRSRLSRARIKIRRAITGSEEAHR